MNMQSPAGNHRELFVSERDCESLLDGIAKDCTHPESGIFGPQSVNWKISRESVVFLGSGRAALLQLAHPWVAAALDDHSTLRTNPIGRFHDTFRIVFTMIFGSLDQAMAAARHLHALHTRIRGEMQEDVASYRRGSHYEANEIGALRWVYATLIESAVLAYECALGPLAADEREQYYAESRKLAGLFGIPAAALPETWEAFTAYNRQMHASQALGVSAGARAIAESVLAGAGSWIHPPYWYRALTTAWMPERFREEFGLKLGVAEQRASEKAKRRIPAIYRRLPRAIRFTGPWQEAQARLAGRRIGALTRWSNQFWIGQAQLPFAGKSVLRGAHPQTTIAE